MGIALKRQNLERSPHLSRRANRLRDFYEIFSVVSPQLGSVCVFSLVGFARGCIKRYVHCQLTSMEHFPTIFYFF